MSETSKLKPCSAPFKTETLFVDEVQPILLKLESHKQANKPVNVHVSGHQSKMIKPQTQGLQSAQKLDLTLIPNLIAETEDIDNQVADICTPKHLFSPQNQTGSVGVKFWKVWQDLGADSWLLSTIKKDTIWNLITNLP